MKVPLFLAALMAVMVTAQFRFLGSWSSGGGDSRPGGCDCQPLVICAEEYSGVINDCQLEDGGHGLCCPAEGVSTRRGPSLAEAPDGNMISVNTRQLFQEALPALPENQLEIAVS